MPIFTRNPIFLVSALFLYVSNLHIHAETTKARLSIDLGNVIKRADPQRLTSTNISLWSRRPIINNAAFQKAIRQWNPALIRIPGGSWSNEYYWNGNGVRIGSGHDIQNFDLSKKRADGTWEVDYSAYKPGFRLHGKEHQLSDYHGDLDVKTQHEWIQDVDAESMVTVNVGSGTPKVAAEWVKWANEVQGYGVKLWEVGNELNGDWELGHRLPDGTNMTGSLYTKRFNAFAAAMHAVDPDIHLGGPACSDLNLEFVEELIRGGGDALDFVSFHAYPVGVNTKNSDEKFAAIRDLRRAVQRINHWIEKYQPARRDEIEIGVSEWNIKVNEDRDTAELINALWSSIWIGTMFEEGVDFANQWDLTTYTAEGGHSAFNIDETNMTVEPKAQYWALWMWSNLMGEEMLSSTLKGDSRVKSFVTRTKDGLQIMLVNTSEDDEVSVTLEGINVKRALLHRYTSSEYFWDPQAKRPLWSRPPSKYQYTGGELLLPKFSISVLQILTETNNVLIGGTKASTNDPSISLRLPDRVAADRAIEAWVVAYNPDEKLPYLGKLPKIDLSIEGPAKLSDHSVALTNATAQFEIIPTGSGIITVSAKAGKLTDNHKIELVSLSERRRSYWTFDNPIPQWQVKSTFKIGSESSIRPNQYVAVSQLHGETPKRDADLLFHFEPLPHNELPLENTSGVVGQLRAAHNLECTDLNAQINVILQSDANHWMPIGSIPLSTILGKWEPFEFSVKDPQLLDAMGKLYALRLQIQASAPITGDIYLDDLGFIFRTGL